jgi:hypothetical protein
MPHVLDDARDVETRLPLSPGRQRHFEPQAAILDASLRAPLEVRPATCPPSLVPQDQLALAELDRWVDRRIRVDLLELENVREVAPEGDVEGDVLLDLGVIANPEILMDAARDDPVTLDRDRRVRADADERRRPVDASRVVVDHATGQHPHR